MDVGIKLGNRFTKNERKELRKPCGSGNKFKKCCGGLGLKNISLAFLITL
jgi:hypothetical protein